MSADSQSERLVLDGAINMTVSEETFQKAVTVGVDVPEIDRAANDNGIGLLDFLVIGQKVIFTKTYLTLGTKLHAPFAAGIV
jgi:hypothetical protein